MSDYKPWMDATPPVTGEDARRLLESLERSATPEQMAKRQATARRRLHEPGNCQGCDRCVSEAVDKAVHDERKRWEDICMGWGATANGPEIVRAFRDQHVTSRERERQKGAG